MRIGEVLTMDEYIERKAAIRALLNDAHEQVGYSREDAADCIRYMDAVDVAPVRHGRWERIGIKGRKALPIYPCCSDCGMVSAAFRSEWEGLRGPWKFCPNCGAKMDGDADD